MKIEEIDKNFANERVAIEGGLAEYAIPHPFFALYGVFYDEKEGCFARMDLSTAKAVSEGVNTLSRHTSGGRLRFSTDSKVLKLTAVYTCLGVMPHMTMVGSSGFTLFEEREKGEIFLSHLTPALGDEKGFTREITLPGEGMRSYILYFPLYNDVSALTIALDEKAKVETGRKYRDILPILYYGSSITQGGCANRADTCYPALIQKKNNIDYINLGFSGNGKAEESMAAYLSGIDCSLFVCDYDHNAPTAEYLQNTHYRLYERYRKARPNTPVLFISKPDFQRDEEAEARLRIIRNTYLTAKKQGDNNVYFLSGKRFYGKENCWDYAVEGCHPTDRGFYRMAEVIYKEMIKIDEKFR